MISYPPPNPSETNRFQTRGHLHPLKTPLLIPVVLLRPSPTQPTLRLQPLRRFLLRIQKFPHLAPVICLRPPLAQPKLRLQPLRGFLHPFRISLLVLVILLHPLPTQPTIRSQLLQACKTTLRVSRWHASTLPAESEATSQTSLKN